MKNTAPTFISLLVTLGCGLVTPAQAQAARPLEYSDVPHGHWAYETLQHLDRGGWINGYPDGRYRGDKSITRYEFARVFSDFGTYSGFNPKLSAHKAVRPQPVHVVFAQQQQWPEFPDIPRTHWGYNAVSNLSMMGVVEGLPNGTYRGNSGLTRYDCVVALARLWNRHADSGMSKAPVVSSYPDVPESHWAFHAISALHKQGLVEGFPNGNFHGEKLMSRYEFAVTLRRVLKLGSR